MVEIATPSDRGIGIDHPAIWAEKQIPAATSQFNVVTEPGFGVLLRPHSHHPLMIGYRFSHISNAGYSSRNPGLNVGSLVVGMTMRR